MIGFLSGASGGDPRSSDIDGLRQGLAESGYVLGRNLKIEYRWVEGQFDRLSALAGDLTSRQVALIVTATLPAAIAAKAASPTTFHLNHQCNGCVNGSYLHNPLPPLDADSADGCYRRD